MKTKISTTPTTNSIYRKMQSFQIWILLLCMICILECRALPQPQDSNESYRRTFAIQYGAPLITPLQEDVILDVDSQYSLRCEANDLIEWKTPHYILPEIETFDTLDPERPYGSVLRLTDINIRDVGYYYCIKKSELETPLETISDEQLSEMVNNNQASNIYIYVNDKNNLLVPIEFSVGYAHQYADVTIPCKPSIPTTEVLLTTPNDQTFSSDSTGRYDPKRGFVVEIRGLTDTGTFICRPKVPSQANEEEETEIVILFDGNEHMDPKTNFINKPVISSESNGHVYEGDTFHLKCEVTIAHDVRYVTEWITPQGVDPSRIEKGEATFKNHTPTHRVGSAVLTVKNAMKSDEGKYKCHVVDQSKNKAQTTYTMTILKKGETYLNVSEPNGYYKINARANNTVQMTVKYRGYPMPVLEWYKSDGNSNSNGTKITNLAHKYDVNTTAVSSTLKIIKAQMTDTGEYLLFANNGVNFERLEFQVTINDTPIVSVKDEYVQVGGEAHVTCKVLSHPKAVVTWLYTPCAISPRWPSCEKNLEQFYNNTRNVRMGESSIEYLYDMYFSPTKPGIMHCVAINAEGRTVGKGHVLIGDISSNMTVYGVDDNRKIARGDEVTITCAALAYFFSDELVWYKDGVEVEQSDDIVVTSDTSDYSYKRTLIFRNIQENHQGTYECRARHINYEKQDNKYINIFVYEPMAPTIVSSNMNSNKKIELKLGEPLKLECRSEAIPRAHVIWYKDDVELSHNRHVIIEDDNTQLLVKFMRPEDEGTYKCFVSNRMGSVEASTAVKITNLPGMQLGWILGLVFFFIFLLGIVCYLAIRVKRGRKLLRELKAAGLANFEEGAVEHINPALTLDEQADLLPYDRNFEFPREKLKLGKQLGAGAFGVVLKAHAEGIKPEERETVVAVKMVKRTADNEVMRALVSELKIMVHLGQHLNVVNLLGAVTKNIAKRELMVIVEFCRFGNVQNFLLRNRKRFIDQINPDTDKIDPTILTQRFSDNFEMNRNSDNDPRSGTRAGRPNSRGYLRQSDLYEGHVDSCATEQTVMTTVPEDEDIMSNNSIQPAWRSNYKSDSTEAMTITTSDLVSWAFQVARGMDYLSSKKVLHGDLAARNILLCEDNVVKICDFGLARSMYKGDNYKKQGEAPLPIKWLALESLSDHIFSTYTDVWSFGIVLWEFFSLAKVPYPGMDPNQNLYLKLKDGYRMDKPVFANDELYDIMLECWSTNPESRPLFHELEKKFARMLGDEVTSHYVDLNDPYMRCNSEYMKNSKTDYLALMGSPDEMAPPPPRYVNGLILPEIRIDSSSDDYMQMSANPGTIIFSPTRPKDYESSNDDANNSTNATSFTFPDTVQPPHSPTLANNLDSPVNKTRKKDGVDVQPEEIPMLHQQHNSDGEPSPDQSRKFANILQQTRPTPTPSPRHVIETKLSGEDEYVNVKSPSQSQSQPQSQTQSPNKTLNNNGERKVDAFSNPSYQMLKTVTETGK